MKVLVIDDTPDLLEVISVCLKLRWPQSIVLGAGTGAEGLRLLEKENPDLVILDLGLPDMDGFDVCRQIRTFSEVPVIMLTVRDRETDIAKGLELGADDYLTKPFNHLELLARAQAVLRRTKALPVSAQPLVVGKLFVDFSTRQVLLDNREVKLTPIEFNLLYQLVKNAGQVVTHRTLLTKVWGSEYTEVTSYLKVFIQHLRQKLGEDARNPTMIISEHGVGYKLVKPSPAAESENRVGPPPELKKTEKKPST